MLIDELKLLLGLASSLSGSHWSHSVLLLALVLALFVRRGLPGRSLAPWCFDSSNTRFKSWFTSSSMAEVMPHSEFGFLVLSWVSWIHSCTEIMLLPLSISVQWPWQNGSIVEFCNDFKSGSAPSCMATVMPHSEFCCVVLCWVGWSICALTWFWWLQGISFWKLSQKWLFLEFSCSTLNLALWFSFGLVGSICALTRCWWHEGISFSKPPTWFFF